MAKVEAPASSETQGEKEYRQPTEVGMREFFKKAIILGERYCPNETRLINSITDSLIKLGGKGVKIFLDDQQPSAENGYCVLEIEIIKGKRIRICSFPKGLNHLSFVEQIIQVRLAIILKTVESMEEKHIQDIKTTSAIADEMQRVRKDVSEEGRPHHETDD